VNWTLWTGLKCKENVNNMIKIKQLSRNLRNLIQQKITRLLLKITRSSEKSLGVAPLHVPVRYHW